MRTRSNIFLRSGKLRAAGLDPERARFAVTDTIEKLGGARPKTFEAFVRDGQSELMAKSA